MAGRQANMRGTGGQRPASRAVLSRRVQSVAGDFSWRIAMFFAQGLAWAIGAGFFFFFLAHAIWVGLDFRPGGTDGQGYGRVYGSERWNRTEVVRVGV